MSKKQIKGNGRKRKRGRILDREEQSDSMEERETDRQSLEGQNVNE